MGGEDPGLLDPFFDEDTIVFVEWPEHAEDAWPAGRVAASRAARARRRRRAEDRDRTVKAIVGIDTATSATSVAVMVPGGREIERRDDPGPGERPRHAETLQPLLEQALEHAEVGWEDVGAHLRRHRARAASPGCGSGSRPRARWRRATISPVVGVSSLEALARGIELVGAKELDLPGDPDLHGPVLAVIDARRGEVFAASYRHHRTTMEPTAITPGELAGGWPRGASGDAARCWPWATGRYAFVRSSSGPEWRCRPTVPAPTASAP